MEAAPIFLHSNALVPFGKAKIQDKFSSRRSGVWIFEAARSASARAETMCQPFLPSQISRLQHDQAVATPLGPRPGSVAPGRGFRTRLFPRALLTANQSFRHCPNSAPNRISPGASRVHSLRKKSALSSCNTTQAHSRIGSSCPWRASPQFNYSSRAITSEKWSVRGLKSSQR